MKDSSDIHTAGRRVAASEGIAAGRCGDGRADTVMPCDENASMRIQVAIIIQTK